MVVLVLWVVLNAADVVTVGVNFLAVARATASMTVLDFLSSYSLNCKEYSCNLFESLLEYTVHQEFLLL